MVYTEYTKKRIVFYHAKGYKAPTIAKLLLDEGIEVSQRGVSNFLVRVEQTGSVARRPGSGQPRKRAEEVKEIVEHTMRADDETTAKELKEKLPNGGYVLSEMTVLRSRSELGWTYRGSSND
jgi:transposase